jgi:tripeptide aminopeptidase
MKDYMICGDALLQRFLRYVKVDTMSDPHALDGSHPSTAGQWELLRMLEQELKDFGLSDVSLDDKGYLLALVPGNVENVPTIGFMAHVDTADDVMGNGVKPRVIDSYDGKDIRLNSEITMLAASNPELAKYVGETIVVTSGDTLLGGDDKAGVAEIMTAVKYLLDNPDIPHGPVEIIFTPDEETGAGMDYFPYGSLRSKACYTVDGGCRYEIETECFNAATVKVHFSGIAAHLGAARGKMVNALTMAAAFVQALPQAESPEATDGRYGYYCAQEISGNATELDLTVYLRDFDLDNLKRRISVLEQLGKTMEGLFAGGSCAVESKIIYYNMAGSAKEHPEVISAIYDAGKELGMPLFESIIRGGTDGARLAEKGVPCPNLFTGGHNLHSRYEWTSLPAMKDSVRLVLGIIAQWAKGR